MVVTQYATEVVGDDGTVQDAGADGGAVDTAAGAALTDAEAVSALESVCGPVDEWQEASHPSLGTVYVGLKYQGNGQDSSVAGCVGAVDTGGNQIFRKTLAIYEDELNFPSPFQDATGNVFVTYNPGRYDGVVTLVPTSDGFEEVGGEDAGGLDYATATHMYYNAELIGPGADGRYQIKTSANDCTPDCAGGAITTEILSWNGTDYS